HHTPEDPHTAARDPVPRLGPVPGRRHARDGPDDRDATGAGALSLPVGVVREGHDGGRDQRLSGAKGGAIAAMTRSAVARFVASGTLWTLQTRINARMSGSWSCASNGSTKKNTASTRPVATRAAIWASPPSGPLSNGSTSKPTFSGKNRP